MAVLKMKLRARLIRKSFSVALPQTNAPALASAFPQVCTTASISFSIPSAAATPRPCGPRTPVACASSTTTRGAVLAREAQNLAERRNVAFHAEDALGDDDARAAGRAMRLERVLEKGEIEVRIDDFVRAGEAHAVDQAGVIERVGKDDVAAACRMELSRPDIRRVAGTEIERRFGAGEVGELGFKLHPFARNCRKAAASRWSRRGAGALDGFGDGFACSRGSSASPR